MNETEAEIHRHGQCSEASCLARARSGVGGVGDEVEAEVEPPTVNAQAEDGKTEMSLVHFTLANPGWQPPQNSEAFIHALRGQAAKDADKIIPSGQR